MEACITQSLQYGDGEQSNVSPAAYYDESERNFLDFNLRLVAQYMRLLAAVSIIRRGSRVVISEAHSLFKVISDAVKMAIPEFGSEIMVDLIKSEDVESMVENSDDIPEFWFGDGEGKPYVSTDRRNVWCYERCLSDGNRITQKDIYNPGPWPYEEYEYAALNVDEPLETGAEKLETIEEDDDDGEW